MDSSVDHAILGEELLPLIRERLAAGQHIRYLPFRGVSMLPLLRQGLDSVALAPLPAKLKKYDLPVYQYPGGKVVMHRVVDVQENLYICLGDNTYEYEQIRPDQMIGLVHEIKRGEKHISVENPGYRLYCRIWVAVFPVRKFIMRAKRYLRRMLK